jgi:hypothetical protein
MALPDLVQFEKGRVISISWYKDGINPPEPETITGATITGKIETGPGPEFTSRSINGALAVSSTNEHTWTIHYDDSYVNGEFLAQFRAVFPGGKELFTIPSPLKVIRSFEWP